MLSAINSVRMSEQIPRVTSQRITRKVLQEKPRSAAPIPPDYARQIVEKSFYIEASQAVFKGHFPGNPILPGVLILGLLKSMLAEHFDSPLRISQIKRQKFSRPVLPGHKVHVQLCNLDIHGEQVDIVYNASVDGQLVAKGSVVFAIDYSQPQPEVGVV